MAFNESWNRRTFLGTVGALAGMLFGKGKAFAFSPAAGGAAAPVSDSVRAEMCMRNWA